MDMDNALQDIWGEISNDTQQNLERFMENMPSIFPGYQMYRLKQMESGQKTGAIPIDDDKAGLYNGDSQQFSIFFTPNGGFADVKGVRRKNVARTISAFVIDRDDTPDNKIKFWESFPLQPSIIVETMKGYHAYRLLDETMDWAKYGEKRDQIQSWLCTYLGGDQNAKDVARIYRMPGYRYWKHDTGNDGKFVTSVYFFDETIKYSFDMFHNMYLQSKNIEDSANDYKKYVKSIDSQNSYERINKEVNVLDVLYAFSARWVVRGVDIYEDGKKTDGYKYNPQGNYLVSFSGHADRPQGAPFSVAKFFLSSDAEVFKYFAENHHIGERKKKEANIKKFDKDAIVMGSDMEDSSTIQVANITIVFSYKDRKTYKIVDDNPPIEIMNGVIMPRGYYVKKTGAGDINVYIIDYEKVNSETGEIEQGTLYGYDFSKKQVLEALLGTKGMTLLANPTIIKQIVYYIHSSDKVYQYINKAGIYGPGFVVNRPGLYKETHDGVDYIIDISGIAPKDRKKNVIFSIGTKNTKEDLEEAINLFTSTYYSPIAQTIFTAYAMGMFAYYIRNNFARMPFISLAGITQTGKTTLRELVQRMFGMDGCLTAVNQSTHFPIMHMSQHYLPVSIAEWKNQGQKFDWDSMLKNNYDNTSDVRGTKDQMVNAYELNAMIVIDGEYRSITNSVYSRSFALQCNMIYKKKEAETVININKYFIDRYDNIYNFNKNFTKWRQLVGKRFEDIEKHEKGRIIDNYAMLLSFAECFDFIDLVQENIITQCKTQLFLMGEDNLIKIIKNIFLLAKVYKMMSRIHKKNIIIDYAADPLKTNAQISADMMSDIANVNAHFRPDREMVTDRVTIPMDYMFQTKALHDAFNSFMGYIFYRETPDPQEDAETRLAIREYAKDNKYTDKTFYELLDADYGEFYEQKAMNRMRNDQHGEDGSPALWGDLTTFG